VKILFLSFTLWRYHSFLITFFFCPFNYTKICWCTVWSKHLRIFFRHLQQSSENVRKCLENVRIRSSGLRNNFGKSSEIFRNWLEIFGKSSKTSSLVCLYNKQNITCPVMDTNFIFLCSTQYLTHSPRSLMRYRVEHSKIKFVSMHGYVISFISDSM